MEIKQVGHDRIFWLINKVTNQAIIKLKTEFKEIPEEFEFDLQDSIKELLIKHKLAE